MLIIFTQKHVGVRAGIDLENTASQPRSALFIRIILDSKIRFETENSNNPVSKSE